MQTTPEQLMGQAIAHHRAGRLTEAEAIYRQILARQPDYADALHLLGVLLWQVNQDPSAADLIRRAMDIDPTAAQYPSSLGNLLRQAGHFDDAIATCRRALQLNPELASAHVNLGVLLLLRGDLPAGWPQTEWRWKWRDFDSRRPDFKQPQWKGEQLHGRKILLHAEQGRGDTIQFIRYAPMVAARGGRVIVACQPELRRLVEQVPGVEQVVTKTPLPAFDVQCPMLSLPGAFDTALESIPATTPYLKPDPALAATWAAALRSDSARLKVGLAWAGNPAFQEDSTRSIRLLSRLAPLGHVSGVTFFSLQKGDAALQTANPPPGMRLIDRSAELNDFADTAALISHLDLVISSDTAVVHLAGAVGKPVWTLLSSVPDWRWLLAREDSPWYPTMRLFRQERPEDWDGVIQRVAASLEKGAG